MKTYIGAKIIQGEPMDDVTFQIQYKFASRDRDANEETKSGYHVVYANPNGEYHSWSPKDVFENAYREVTKGEVRMVVAGNRV